MTRLSFPFAAGALALLTLTGSAPAQDIPPVEKLLPPNVYALATIPDVKVLHERGADSSFGALFNDPSLDPLKEQLRTKFEKASGEVEEKLGLSLKELLAIPSGQLSVAVFDVPEQKVGVVAIIEYGDSKEAVDTLIKKAETALQKEDAIRTEVEFEGTTIIVYKGDDEESGSQSDDEVELDIEGSDSDDSTDSPFTGTIARFQKDGTIVIGNSAPALEVILARWDGQHPKTLAENEVYSYIAQKAQSDDRPPAFSWFIDPIGGLQKGIAVARSSGSNLPTGVGIISSTLPILGVTSLKGIGGGFDLATSEYNSVSNTFLYIEVPPGGTLGILSVFHLLPAELAPPAWVTENVTAYVGATWDAAGAIAAAEKLVDTFKGPGFFDRLMERAANAEGGPKINPIDDVIDRLSGRIHLVNYPIKIRGEATKTTPKQPTVIGLGLDDAAGIKDVLARLATTPNFPGTSRQFEGATLYEMPTGTAAQGAVAFTVANDCLLFATDVGRLEQILRDADQASLAESDAFQKVAGHFPDEQLMISYQDQRDQLETVYEMLRKGALDKQTKGFDWSVLPPFEDIAKYMRQGGSYAVSDERGALFVSFTLKDNSK